ncbi:MAG: hypothetical protein C0490_20295 [Marivirga sp.]|nr:hypothetical protein [Marivirga sp.]
MRKRDAIQLNKQKKTEMKTIEIVYVSVACSSESKQKFGEYLQQIAEDVRKIEGCIKFDYLNSPESTNRFVAYIEFDSTESYLRYKRSEAIRKINTWLFPLHTSPPVFRHYQATLLESSDI